MKTINAIYHIVNEFAQKQKGIMSKNKREYEEECLSLKERIKTQFLALRDQLPEFTQYEFNDVMSLEETGAIVERIRSNAKKRVSLDLLPTGDYFKDNVQDNIIYTPKFVNWQQDSQSGHNFILNFSGREKEKADLFMNSLIFNMLISLPAKAVHLSFVDLGLSGGYERFTQDLDSSMCGKTVMGTQEFGDLLRSLTDRMRDALQKYGDAVKYNIRENTIKIPYEVVVLVNYPNNYNSYQSDLYSLFENGYKGGIYFVVMNNTDIQVNDNYKSLYDMTDCFQEIVIPETKNGYGFISQTPLFQNHIIRQGLLDSLNSEANLKEEKQPIKSSYAEMVKQPYEPLKDTISIPVGEIDNGNKVLFQLSTVGHIHSFILGQSGSGKSVFLHNVIMGAIAKYSPEDLHLYLMDFKLGGVEFNRYKNEKHVRALLVDNSDIQITLEILRDINEQMRERGKLLRSSGVSNIVDYNELNPTNRMPRILFVADECHVMFNPSNRSQNKQYNEISNIIIKIAKEGRSQGVHLVFATQTLAQTEISSEILNNISDHYLLKCAIADSEKMVRDSSNITSNLTTGEVYYHGRDDHALFKAYFVPTPEGVKLVDAVKEKTMSFEMGEQFYFVGSQIFNLDEDVEKELCNYQGNYPIAAIGRSINIKQTSVTIPLKKDDAENIMLFGIDEEGQVSGTSLALLNSMISSTKGRDIVCRYLVMNFLGDEFFKREAFSDAEFVSKREIGRTLYQLCEDIDKNQALQTALFIFGQEKFRDLKFDNKIEGVGETVKEEEDSDDFGFGSAFTDSPKNDDKYDTYRKALSYILDYGGEQGVHVVLQIDKPEKFMFEEYVTGKTIFSKFKYIIMLRSDENAINRLNLSDDIALENLSSDPERLRAIYYNEPNDSYVLLTPYRINNN